MTIETAIGQPARNKGRDPRACLSHDLTGLSVDQVALQPRALDALEIEGCAPALLAALVVDHLVEEIENFLGIETERAQQRGDRQLATAINADINDVLCIELEIKPRATIGNHPRRKEIFTRGVGFALIMIEEDARRAVHLANDDTLRAVDHKGALVGHERHVAHEDVLFLDITHRARTGFLVNIPDDEAQGHAQWCSIGYAALLAFLYIVLG